MREREQRIFISGNPVLFSSTTGVIVLSQKKSPSWSTYKTERTSTNMRMEIRITVSWSTYKTERTSTDP
jgi:hypothetical protein